MDFMRPPRCSTCKHHILGCYDPETDYQEHWCEMEENERTGWFVGMHLDNCLFSALGVPLCPVYEMAFTPQDRYIIEQVNTDVITNTESPKLKVLITREQILLEVKRLAQEINEDYKGKNPLLLGILKGSFVFLADIIRFLTIPVEIDFVRLSSYGSSKVSSGKIRMVHGLKSSIEGKDIIIVDDIVDTGLAISHLNNYVNKKKPASLKLCAFLDKPSHRKTDVCIDYLGITIPDKFVVGYGLDCDEKYRYLPDICVLED